jgi:hypothetical protein
MERRGSKSPAPAGQSVPRRSRVTRYVVFATVAIGLLLVLVAGFAAWRTWREISAVPQDTQQPLPPLPAESPLADIELAAPDDDAPLRFAALETDVVLLLCEPSAFSDPTAAAWLSALGDALEDRGERNGARAIAVLAAPDLPRLLRGVLLGIAKSAGEEFPCEMRVDFGRKIADALAIPKGTTAVASVARDGRVQARYAGEPTGGQLAALRAFLGAPPRAAPTPLPRLASFAPVQGKAAALLVLGREVDGSEVVETPGSPLAMMLSGLRPPSDPTLRLLAFVMNAGNPATTMPRVVIAGSVTGELPERLRPHVESVDAVEIRTAFGIARGEAALVAIDGQARVTRIVRGLAPMWKLAAAGRELGFDPPFAPEAVEPTSPSKN